MAITLFYVTLEKPNGKYDKGKKDNVNRNCETFNFYVINHWRWYKENLIIELKLIDEDTYILQSKEKDLSW